MALTQIPSFKVERWFDDYETTCKYNIAETCAASISVEDLKRLSEDQSTPVLNLGVKLTYGSIRGSEALRSNLSSLYSAKTANPLPANNVLITSGAIAANFLTLYTLLGKGDHVICQHPTYQQLYSVPASMGAEVDLWKTGPEDKWQLSIATLKSLIKPNTKMIIVNNPQNPTGAHIPKSKLEEIVGVAREHNLIILSDEVYRPLFHGITPMDAEFPPSIVSMGYERVIATGSMSKAFALAGIRVGWIASRSSEIIEACAAARDYTTISVSQIDDQIATFALNHNCIHALLGRNIKLAKTNVAILDQFIEENRSICQWVKPRAGTTAFVKFSRDGSPVDDVEFCKMLQAKRGVMFAPGNLCFAEGNEFRGYIRIGYVCETDVLVEGLREVSAFLQGEFADVPTV